MMFIVLPSGRRLVYVKPKMGLNRFGNESVTYEGVGEQKKWLRLESYGPKFVENIVQATARDILAEAMLRLNAAGYRIVMHVHDEAVIEAPPETELSDICSIMDKKWKNKDISWEDLCARCSNTIRTTETVEEYRKLKKGQQDAIKDVGGFVGGHLREGRRKNGMVACRSLLTLDMDYGTTASWNDMKRPNHGLRNCVT